MTVYRLSEKEDEREKSHILQWETEQPTPHIPLFCAVFMFGHYVTLKDQDVFVPWSDCLIPHARAFI